MHKTILIILLSFVCSIFCYLPCQYHTTLFPDTVANLNDGNTAWNQPNSILTNDTQTSTMLMSNGPIPDTLNVSFPLNTICSTNILSIAITIFRNCSVTGNCCDQKLLLDLGNGNNVTATPSCDWSQSSTTYLFNASSFQVLNRTASSLTSLNVLYSVAPTSSSTTASIDSISLSINLFKPTVCVGTYTCRSTCTIGGCVDIEGCPSSNPCILHCATNQTTNTVSCSTTCPASTCNTTCSDSTCSVIYSTCSIPCPTGRNTYIAPLASSNFDTTAITAVVIIGVLAGIALISWIVITIVLNARKKMRGDVEHANKDDNKDKKEENEETKKEETKKEETKKEETKKEETKKRRN